MTSSITPGAPLDLLKIQFGDSFRVFSLLPSKDEPALQGNFAEQLTELQLVEATSR